MDWTSAGDATSSHGRIKVFFVFLLLVRIKKIIAEIFIKRSERVDIKYLIGWQREAFSTCKPVFV